MPDLTEKVVNLAKRRGFVFPSSEIYGGFRSTYDYGPLGVLLKRNVMEAWWRAMVQERDDIVGLDAAILMAPKVWEASGHLATFTDPLVDCRNCKERWRADQIGDACPKCGSHDLTEARPFNLMFKTHVGPVENEGSVAYLRPETAQGIFVNFAQRAPDEPQEAAVRHRPAGQVVPQRDHARQLHLPHPRVRADGDGVLRAARPGPEVVRVLVRGALALVHRPGHPRRRRSACATTTPRSCPTTRAAPPTSSSSTRGAGASWRASPTAPTTTSPSTPSSPASGWSTSTRRPTSATCPT